MILLDTHAFVWRVAEPSRLSRAAKRLIDSADAVGVCAISAWEVATLVRKRRLVLDRPVGEWLRLAFAQPGIEELPLTARVAALAGSFDESFHGDTADRLIAATALDRHAVLVTKDDALRAMPMLTTVW